MLKDAKDDALRNILEENNEELKALLKEEYKEANRLYREVLVAFSSS